MADVYVGLDLSTRSAACYGPYGRVPALAHIGLGADATRGERALALLHWLRQLFESIKRYHGAYPKMVFIEAPLTPRVMVEIGTQERSTIELPGLVVVAELVCSSRKIPSQLIKRQDALQHFTRRRTYTKPQKIPGVKQLEPSKAACLARCKQLGWPATTGDEADAAAIFDTGCATHVRGAALVLAERPMQKVVKR